MNFKRTRLLETTYWALKDMYHLYKNMSVATNTAYNSCNFFLVSDNRSLDLVQGLDSPVANTICVIAAFSNRRYFIIIVFVVIYLLA